MPGRRVPGTGGRNGTVIALGILSGVIAIGLALKILSTPTKR